MIATARAMSMPRIRARSGVAGGAAA